MGNLICDTDSKLVNSYEWKLVLRGVKDDLSLIENTEKNSPSPDWGDTAEGIPIEISIV